MLENGRTDHFVHHRADHASIADMNCTTNSNQRCLMVGYSSSMCLAHLGVHPDASSKYPPRTRSSQASKEALTKYCRASSHSAKLPQAEWMRYTSVLSALSNKDGSVNAHKNQLDRPIAPQSPLIKIPLTEHEGDFLIERREEHHHVRLPAHFG